MEITNELNEIIKNYNFIRPDDNEPNDYSTWIENPQALEEIYLNCKNVTIVNQHVSGDDNISKIGGKLFNTITEFIEEYKSKNITVWKVFDFKDKIHVRFNEVK